LRTLGKTELPRQLTRWLDELDETGRWALLKLLTGAMRIGISARLAKTAAAALGDKDPHDIELMWPGLAPPYLDLFAWLEGRGETFNVLQQRLNRKVVSPKLTKDYPIHLRAYDLLADGDNDLRELPFAERRTKLEEFVKKLGDISIDLSPTIAFDNWQALTA